MMTLRKAVCISIRVTAFVLLLTPNLNADDSARFTSKVQPFLENYCFDCHGEDTQKGGVAFHELKGINADNARLWKSIWEQVALKEMPPKKKKTQPTLEERQQLAEFIVAGMQRALKEKGGYDEHLHPHKGNLLDHDLLFGELPKNLKPTSSPSRIWRVHPQEQFTRFNELISIEPPYDPKKSGARAHGDPVPTDGKTGTHIYLGVYDVIEWTGSAFSLHHSLKNITPILSTKVKRGIQNYPYLYSVNSSEALRISNDAEIVLRFMAYGPNVQAFQLINGMSDVDEKHRGLSIYKGRTIMTKHGVPEGVFYNKKSKRPITPIHNLMAKSGVDDKRLKSVVDFMFEALTLRPPTPKESAAYLRILKQSIEELGKEEGVILGLTPVFLDRAALFRTELCEAGKPDKHGRVMLQDQELILAINAAFSYIAPDEKLKQALEGGRLKTREDVKREVTRILNDDSIRKPVILRFFREYFDYDLAAKVDKDDNLLKRAGGLKTSKAHRQLMTEMTATTDRLVELILKEDKDVLAELLTTDRVVLPEDSKNFGYFAEMKSDGKIVGKPSASTSSKKGSILPLLAKDLPGIIVDNHDAKVTGVWTKSNRGKDRVGEDYLISEVEGNEKAIPLTPLRAKDLPGIIVDNPDAKATGKWGDSNGIENRVGSEYLLSKTPGDKVVYPVSFPKAGKYEVRMTIAQHRNRASQAVVTVRHKGGKETFRIDQRRSPGTFNKNGSDSYFQSLGSFEFPSGPWDAVEISNKGGGGFVVADAVQFLPPGVSGAIEQETEPAAPKQKSKLVYPVTFPKAGRYEVQFSYGRHPGCSIATLVTVRHKNGETKFRIDQTGKGKFFARASDECFQSLGYFDFPAGPWDAVEVSNEKGNISKFEQAPNPGKYVVADAVQFLLAGTSQVRDEQTKLIKSPGGEIVHVRLAEYSEIKGRRRANDPIRFSSGERHLVRLPASQRKGILTHPIWLVAHSDAMDNHAILRGKWIRERLLGGAIADVPITVDAVLPDEPKETLRHRMRVVREEQCWKCHQKMDPLGLPFEMYNHAGLFRSTELGSPVDATGAIIDSGEASLDGPVNNALEMIEKLSRSERVKQVFVRHAFRYWMGRNETINDAPVLQDAYKAYEESDGSMKALLISLLTSDAFLYRRTK